MSRRFCGAAGPTCPVAAWPGGGAKGNRRAAGNKPPGNTPGRSGVLESDRGRGWGDIRWRVRVEDGKYLVSQQGLVEAVRLACMKARRSSRLQ